MANRPSIRIGKLSSKGMLFPTEPGYVESMRATTKELENILAKLMKDVEDATPPIMLDILAPTKVKSDLYCPKDTHALVNSGYLEVTSFRGSPRVELGYARGGQPSYGVVVHENMSFKHKAPTRAKWLQAAMFEDLPQMYERLGASYKASMGL